VNGELLVVVIHLHKILFILFIIFIGFIISVRADQSVYGNLYVQDNVYGDNITARPGYYFIGSGLYITGLNTSHINLTAESPLVLTGDVLSINNVYVNISGDTWQGNMNAGAYSLTNLGSLVMAGTITSKDIIPDTTELYTLGNSTHWFDEAFIKTLHSEDIFTDRLNTSEVNSTNVNSDNVDIDVNLTFEETTFTEESESFVIII